MKIASISILIIQIVLFIVLSAIFLWFYNLVLRAGGAFWPGLQWLQLSRLIAFLSPCLILPLTSLLTFIFYKKSKYKIAIILPLFLIAATYLMSQLYLKVVPDPIRENFGPRSTPYKGFLIPGPDTIPFGFKEIKHNYTKRDYSVHYSKNMNGKRVNLNISESVQCIYGHNASTLVKEFLYRGIKGEIYIHHPKQPGYISYNLIWLNPPRQRISIYLSQEPSGEYKPDDLIRILKSMKEI